MISQSPAIKSPIERKDQIAANYLRYTNGSFLYILISVKRARRLTKDQCLCLCGFKDVTSPLKIVQGN